MCSVTIYLVHFGQTRAISSNLLQHSFQFSLMQKIADKGSAQMSPKVGQTRV